MTDHEIIELLGGGELGKRRHENIKKGAKGRQAFDKCSECGRQFLFLEFAHLVLSATIEERVTTGKRINHSLICNHCQPPLPSFGMVGPAWR